MANATSDQLQELYVAYFGRAADPAGLEYWTEKGITQADFASIMHAQPEFDSAYGSSSVDTQVNQIYQNLFDRQADVGGLSYWTKEINLGNIKLAEIATHLIFSAQNEEKNADDNSALTNKTAAAVAFTAKINESTAARIAYTAANDGKEEGSTYSAGANINEAINYLSGIDKDTAHTDEGIAASVTTITTNETPGVSGDSFALTTNVDNFSGGAGKDSFSGSHLTLTAGDDLDGGAGSDTLNVSASAAANLGGFTVSNVESVLFSSSVGALAPDMLNVTGATTVGANGSSNDVTFTNINDLPTLRLANNSAGDVSFGNLASDVEGTVAKGTGETQTLEIVSAVNGVVTIASIEELNITNSGTSTITTLTTTAATKLNLTGTGDLTLTNIDDAVKTIDGSAYTGKVTYGGIGANDMTITGGTGKDTFDFTGGNPTKDDIVDGGDGTDTLRVDVALTAASAIAGFSNVEKLHLDANIAGGNNPTISAALFDEVEIQVGDSTNNGAIETITLSNAKTTQALTLDDDGAAEFVDANDGIAVTVTQAIGVGTSTDVLTVTMEGETVNTFTANQYETINISSDEAANTLTSLAATTAQNIVLTGSKNLTLTAVDMEEQAVATGFTSKIDASGLSGKLVMTMTNDEGDQTILGGSADDTITMAGNYIDSDDTVTGNGGTDTLVITNLAGDVGEVNVDVEKLELELLTATGGIAGVIDLRESTSLEEVTIDLDTTVDNITVNNMASGTKVIIEDAVGATADVVTLDGVSGNNEMTVTFSDEAVGADFNGRLTANFDTLTLKTKDSLDDISIAVLSGATIDTLNLQGAGDITITSATTTSSIDTLDASSMTGAVTLTSIARASGATIKLGGGNDSVNFVTTSHAANTITAGAGTDTIVITGATSSNLSIDLSSTTDQISNVAAAANAAVQTGFENVTATGVTVSGITLTGNSDGNTVLGSLQADTITAGTGALAVTGDDGGDIITLTASTGRDTVTVATGDSTGTISGGANAGVIAAYDVITGYNVGTTAANKDCLDVQGTPHLHAAGNVDSTNTTLTIGGDTVDITVIAADGEVTFQDGTSNIEIAADACDSNALLAVAVQALQGTDLGGGGETVWWTGQLSGVDHTWLYTQSGTAAGGSFVDLVGVKATAIETTASTTANIVFMA